MHVLFLLCGFTAVACVALITVYTVASGTPAVAAIGWKEFLFGTVWKSTAAEPRFGILPFILTSLLGTLGAVILGVPVGLLTAVFLSKMAPPRLAGGRAENVRQRKLDAGGRRKGMGRAGHFTGRRRDRSG